MKKLKLCVLVLITFSTVASAQLEIKTNPHHIPFAIRDLYLEYRFNKRIGLELGFGGVPKCDDLIYCYNNQKGWRGLLATKYYMYLKDKEDDLHVGLYMRPRKLKFDKKAEETSIGLGVMAGYKWVSNMGILFEFSLGIHSYSIIKDSYHPPHSTLGPLLRLMVGYRF